MASEIEILTHGKTHLAFVEALQKVLSADTAVVKELGLPGFTDECKIEISESWKTAGGWDKEATEGEINFCFEGSICAHVVVAEGTAKLTGLTNDWSRVPADYAAENARFKNMKVRAKVIA